MLLKKCKAVKELFDALPGVEMAEAFIKDQKKTLPCAAYLNGDYGYKDIYAGLLKCNDWKKIIKKRKNFRDFRT